MAAVTTRLLWTVGAAAAAAAVGACGGGGGNEDETKVKDAITESLNSTDPSSCEKLATERFLKQSQLEKDSAAALKSCQEDAPSSRPTDSIEFGEVSVGGDTSEATFTPGGGDNSGATYSVRLTKEGDQWKLDEITKVTIDDRAVFDAATKAGLERPPDPLTSEQADCIIEKLGKKSDGDIEEVLEQGDGAVVQSAAVQCVGRAGRRKRAGSGGSDGGAADRSRFARMIRKQLVTPPRALSGPVADCVVKRLKVDATDAEVGSQLSGKDLPSLVRKAGTAARACANAG